MTKWTFMLCWVEHEKSCITSGPGCEWFGGVYTSTKSTKILTIVMLKKRYYAHLQFSANWITWSRLLTQIHILNGKQCRSRSAGFFRSQLMWIYTVFKDRVYPGSAVPGFIMHLLSFQHSQITKVAKMPIFWNGEVKWAHGYLLSRRFWSVKLSFQPIKLRE